MNSTSLELWWSIEKGTGYEASGPEFFTAVMDKLQKVTDAKVYVMVERLREMKLKEEHAQDCERFKDKVSDIYQQTEGSGKAPNDLTSLVAGEFLDCAVLVFDMKEKKYLYKSKSSEV